MCGIFFSFLRFSNYRAIDVPEIKEVAEFMEYMLGDCSGDEDKTFLTLRVHTVFCISWQNYHLDNNR